MSQLSSPDVSAGEVVEDSPINEADSLALRRLDALVDALGSVVVQSEVVKGDLYVRVDRANWVQAVRSCRDLLGLSYFCFLSGIDWLPDPNPSPGSEAPAPFDPSAGFETGVTGGETRFQVLARLFSVTENYGVTLKADLDSDAPSIETISGIFRGADWHEREAWEMYGFDFVGHPHLVHLYLPEEFEGFPLRKDYPLLAREVKPWPGLVDVEPMPGESDDEGGEE